jgi:hypothetical protein
LQKKYVKIKLNQKYKLKSTKICKDKIESKNISSIAEDPQKFAKMFMIEYR